MKSIFFLVSGMSQYKDSFGYHANFFETNGAFTIAFVAALIIAFVCAAIFYFGFCMSGKTFKAATLPTWIITLIVACACTFLFTSQVLIGHDSSSFSDDEEEVEDDVAGIDEGNANSIFHNFYLDMENYYNIKSQEDDITEEEINELMDEKETIKEALNQGEDVALMFNLNATLFALIFFYIISIIMKGFTVNGVCIPHKWPHK